MCLNAESAPGIGQRQLSAAHLEGTDLLGGPVKCNHLTVQHSRFDTFPQELWKDRYDIWELGCVVLGIAAASQHHDV